MKKPKMTTEELKKLEEELRASLLADKVKYAKFGIDLGKFWKTLSSSESVGNKT